MTEGLPRNGISSHRSVNSQTNLGTHQRVFASSRPESHYRGINLTGFWRLVEIDRRIRDHDYPNCQQLADLFEVTRRTSERDVERLKYLFGAPVEYDSKRRGYYYSTSFTLPALRLQEGEAIAIFLGQRLLMQCKGTPFEQFVADAMAKIRALLPQDVEVSFDRVTDSMSFQADPLRGDEVEVTQRQQLLYGAIQRKTIVSIEYFTAARGTVSHREIDPYHLRFDNGAWYCIGFCHTRNEIRTFALDRILNISETDKHFAVPAHFSVDEYLADSLSLERGQPRKVVIEFDSTEAPYVLGKTWHKSQIIEERPDGSLLMTLNVGSLGEIKRWVMSLGSHAWVVEPEELREEIRRELEGARERYTLEYGRS